MSRLYRRSTVARPTLGGRQLTLVVMSGKPRESWSYSGEAWTDGDGRAVVHLPSFIRTHRAGFEYELTPVGLALLGDRRRGDR